MVLSQDDFLISGLPEHPYTDADVQRAARQTPLAGGPTYTPRWTRDEADAVVSEPREFARADSNDVVYIADNEVIDVTGLDPFDLNGTAVIGGRHKSGVKAGMVVDTEGGPGSISYRGIFQARSRAGHVEGIRIRGSSWFPDRAGRYAREAPSDARSWPGYTHVPKEGTTRSERDKMRSDAFGQGVRLHRSNSTVRNCDIHGFTHAGVTVGTKNDVPKNVEITHSQLHNCCIPGLGYPVNIYNGEVLSKYNYYNAYRHSITGFGHPQLGYTTRYDVHGPDALLSPVDMHCLAENGGGSGNLTAGKYVHVDHSTFLAGLRYETPGWYSKANCPAVSIRGEPVEGIYVTNSQFIQSNRDDTMRHVNVTPKFEKWKFSNNEYGEDNWTGDNGAQINFGSGAYLGGAGPEQQALAWRARRRALADQLEVIANV